MNKVAKPRQKPVRLVNMLSGIVLKRKYQSLNYQIVLFFTG
jgi:hypothetical protein